MCVSHLYTLTPSLQYDTALKHLTSAVSDLQPTSIRPWERCARFWSQTKTGQDEEAMLKIVPGVLNPVVTVHMQDTCVMLHPGKPGQVQHLVECGPATDVLLTSLQYNQAKEVMFTGTEYTLGDVSVVLGRVTRRTNDLQQVCIFMSLWHHEGCMLSRLETVLHSFAVRIRDSVKVLGSGQELSKLAEFRRVRPINFQQQGDFFTPCHEALYYFHVAMQ
eukprot:jgi/Ulvmu1/9978/UM059_0027.1